MIKLVSGKSRNCEPRLVDAMFRGRAAVFRDRLHWDVTVESGWEVDAYDGENPLYLIAVEPSAGQVTGSLRLMPTTGRTLLKEVFASAFDEPVDLASATLWEGTRFCVHPDAPPQTTRAGINRTTCELFLGMCEVGLRVGAEQIIGVCDDRMARIYRRLGWAPDVIARSDKMRDGAIYVGLWDVGAEALAAMRERSGIAGSVIEEGPSPGALDAFVA